jgi:TonB family protein
MKRNLLILSLILLTTSSFCQKVKQIVKKFRGSREISEVYSVLNSDKKIKHGEYISYFKLNNEDKVKLKEGYKKSDDNIKAKGTYNKGKKEGIWIEHPTRTRKESGNYSDGKKVGIWDTYSENDTVKFNSYNYDIKKKVGIWYAYTPDGKALLSYDYDNNIELEPRLAGFSLSYPDIAKRHDIQGTVVVEYHITGNCTIDSIKTVKSLSAECDQVVIDIVKKTRWVLEKYGKNCKDRTENLSITFKLEY